MVIRSIAAAVILFAASSAHAHAMLEDATPAVGSRGPAPSQVQLIFDSDIVPAASSVSIQGPNGFGGPARLFAANDYTLVLALKPPVPPGRYHVSWRVTSRVDHHVNEGDFTFDVKP